MTNSKSRFQVSRRGLLQTGMASLAMPAILSSAPARAAAGAPVTKVLDFETRADVAKAEAEGEVLFYTHDSDPGSAVLMDAFSKDFPKIKGRYVRAQTGALFSKLLAERSAGRYICDVVQFSDIATALDMQKRGNYELYDSPNQSRYDARFLSTPPGYFFQAGVTFCGIAYNTDRVSEAEAPKTWKDLLDPKWRNAMSCKQATSGTQFVQWYELKQLYGDGFWKEFAKQRPRAFDSRAQLFDRLAKGDDKICAMAEWAGYELVRSRGAKVKFVTPPAGLPATVTAAGIASKPAHPEAAKLFLDWLMTRGQVIYQENKYFLYPSLAKNPPPMPGGMKLTDFKILYPADVQAFAASHATFVKEWNSMMGL
jgi:iron(III) transport system substrate-binding protein